MVVLAKNYGIRAREFSEMPKVTFVPFTAQTRMSGVDMDGRKLPQRICGRDSWICRGKMPEAVEKDVKAISSAGGTPLVVATREAVLGTIQLKDIVKGGLADRFERFRAMGIRTVMITGDNPLTAAAIAKRREWTISWPKRNRKTSWPSVKRATKWPSGGHDR